MINRLLFTIFFCLVSLPTLAVCRVGLSDLRGAFTLLNASRGRFPWCTGNLLMTSSQRVVTRFQISDGTGGAYSDPCARALPATLRYRALKATSAKYGRTIYRNYLTEPWTCNTNVNISMRVFRTADTVGLRIPAAGTFKLAKGYLHVQVTDGWRGCIWFRSGEITVRASPDPGIGNGSSSTTSTTVAEPAANDNGISDATSGALDNGRTRARATATASPAASPAPPIDGSSNSGSATDNNSNSGAGGAENNNQRGGSRNIWEWLGPVLGAGATIIAAVLTVYLSREYWSNRFQRERMMHDGGTPSVSVALDGNPRE